MKINAFTLPFILAISSQLHAQSSNPYIHEGAIGKTPPKVETAHDQGDDAFRTIEIENWVGEKIIFASESKKLQHYGYQSFSHPPKPGDRFSRGIPYQGYVGRIGTIKKVTKVPIVHRVEVEMDDGEILIGEAYFETLHGIVFLRDLDLARKLYLGKKLWLADADLVGVDEAGENFHTVKAKRFSAVNVKEVVTGEPSTGPVKFILETEEGQEGYATLQFSGTNIAKSLRHSDDFGKHFHLTDPKKIYAKWGKKVLDAINREKVFIGMTKEQAIASWGRPETINSDKGSWGVREQWVYGERSYLYFSNGKLTSIQN